jgi:beta-glucosidase
VLNHTPAYPAEPRDEDRQAAQINDGLSVRWYMDPIFRGAYSADLIEHLGADAPRIASGDLALIRQPLDFLGINFYTRSFISTRQPPLPAPGELFTDMGWEIYPQALTAAPGTPVARIRAAAHVHHRERHGQRRQRCRRPREG